MRIQSVCVSIKAPLSRRKSHILRDFEKGVVSCFYARTDSLPNHRTFKFATPRQTNLISPNGPSVIIHLHFLPSLSSARVASDAGKHLVSSWDKSRYWHRDSRPEPGLRFDSDDGRSARARTAPGQTQNRASRIAASTQAGRTGTPSPGRRAPSRTPSRTIQRPYSG